MALQTFLTVTFDFSDVEKARERIDEALEVQGLLAAKEIGQKWYKESFPRTPEEEHVLAYSYHHEEFAMGDLIHMMAVYDATDPMDGFHYAAYQHEEDLDHFGPEKQFIKPLAQDHYLEFGVNVVQEIPIYAKHVRIALG